MRRPAGFGPTLFGDFVVAGARGLESVLILGGRWGEEGRPRECRRSPCGRRPRRPPAPGGRLLPGAAERPGPVGRESWKANPEKVGEMS